MQIEFICQGKNAVIEKAPAGVFAAGTHYATYIIDIMLP